MKLNTGFAILIALTLSSCSTMQRRTPSGLTASRFLQLQRDRQKAFHQLSGKVGLRYEGIKDSISGNGRYLSGTKHQYRLEIRDPLGRLHYLAALSDKNFQAHYPRQSKAYIDDQGGRAYLKKLAGISLDFHSLVGLAVGIIPRVYNKNSMDSWEWDEAAGLYRGDAKIGTASVEYAVDGASGTLVSLSVRNPTTVVEVQYSDLEPCCDGFELQQTLARVAEVRWPQSRASFNFEWNDLKSLSQEPKAASFEPVVEDTWKVTRF
jgi:hypothetical protein